MDATGTLNEDSEIFTLQARACKRCGRILTKWESVERGYGCQCAKREEERARAEAPLPGQINIYEWLEGTEWTE